MRWRRAFAALWITVPGVFLAASSTAEVRFNLRGHVPASCAIEDQAAARAGAETLVDLQVLCNLRTFSVTATGAADLSLETYALSSGRRQGGAPVITERGATVNFGELGPGRHHIRLRILTHSASTQLVLDTL